MGNPFDAGKLTSPGELYQMGLKTFPAYRDLDGSLTKAFMMSHRGKKFELTMHKRPTEELYRIDKDSDQLRNLVGDPKHAPALKRLRERINSVMTESNDPRVKDAFDGPPWVAD